MKVKVHRLQAFQKYGLSVFRRGIQVRHLNGNSLDNSISNIAIGTCRQNAMDKEQSTRVAVAIKASSKNRKLSDKVIKEIRSDRLNGDTYKELMVKYGITSKGTMSHIINNDYVTKV